MKKIFFSERFGLTQAVLEGRKTMTRRIVPEKLVKAIEGGVPGFAVMESKYKVGEVVAVAQRYKDIRDIIGDIQDGKSIKSMAGWNNNMFVRADRMPHHVRITNVKVERLQDITDEDCGKEGIDYVGGYSESYYFGHGVGNIRLGNSYREAFAALIDKVSGKGTWDSNPWVYVYDFELVK